MNSLSVSKLESMIGMWLNGTSAKSMAPEDWHEDIKAIQEGEVEIRLLVLVGQALEVAMRPQPDASLRFMCDLPLISIPYLQGAERSRFSRLYSKNKEPISKLWLLQFLASRQRAPHPFDWMPSRETDTLPNVYLPLLAWKDSDSISHSILMGITENKWDDFIPNERIIALTLLRQQNPTEVPKIYVTKFHTETAEMRIKLLEVLSSNLGDHDIEFLRSLNTDRAPRVRQIARYYLARLGEFEPEEKDTQELLQFIEKKTTGLFQRHPVLLPIALKNQSQKKHRAELLERTELADLGKVLKVTIEDLVGYWKLDHDIEADLQVSKMINRTAPDEVVQLWASRVLEQSNQFHQILQPLSDRLSATNRHRVAEKILTKEFPIQWVVTWAAPDLGNYPLTILTKSPEWESLLSDINEPNGPESKTSQIRERLFCFGLLANAAAAAEMEQILIKAGLPKYDSSMVILQFNATLNTNPSL